jgi:hypothetical protein
MKIGEILRQLAAAIEADDSDGIVSKPGDLMVNPLQQTHELLKKGAGVENHVDVFAADDPNEIARLQQMAGIQPAASAPVINQTIVINTGQPGQEVPTVETTAEVSEVSKITEEPAVVKPVKQMSYKDNYANVSENDDIIIDVRNAYDKLREEFEAISFKKGKK